MPSSRARWVAVGVLVATLFGRVLADAVDVIPGVLTLWPPPSASAAAPAPGSVPVAPSALPPVATGSPLPTATGLARALDPLLAQPSLGGRVSAAVLDVGTGGLLLDADAKAPRASASTTKLLTGAAVLSAVGGTTRLTTRVVSGAAPGQVVLVGGGDMLLGSGRSTPDAVAGRAGLGTLAAEVARSLPADAGRTLSVAFDDGLFVGPNANPRWARADVASGLTGRVSALGLAADRAVPGRPSSADPAQEAAKTFAKALAARLRGRGIAVSPNPTRARAGTGAPELGSVQSAQVGQVLAIALAESDNALAEVLARLTARAMGRPATFDGSALAVLDRVRSLGVETAGARIVDGSGLGRGSVIPARVLVAVLALAAGDRRPELRPLLTGLPVAGLTGTLADRFDRPRARPAAGLVRAKTGTLTGVGALAGITVDADGRLLAFAVMADDVPASGTLAARATLDLVAAALVRCGCR
jgi:serine-type D-Ala-D-Ala carboxypeptidase/endopeptidase (penicillin-binding protein 4)